MTTETENFSFKTKAHISISRVDHSTSIMKQVDDIFQKQLFTDVCLSCENQIINAHRLILAASTSFFHSLFSTQSCCFNAPKPVIVMRDIKINELKAILEFIYYGKVVVPEEELISLIKSAESLGVYGLSKLNPEKINESKDEEEDNLLEQSEINNNNILIGNSSKNSNENTLDEIKKPNKIMNLIVQDKNKRKSIIKVDNEINKDLEEKRKKKEIINQTSNQQPQDLQSKSSNRQSLSKRQSLRIRYRKNDPDQPKDQTTNAFDLLNTSNNSESSLSDVMGLNGKRLKNSDSDSHQDTKYIEEDDLMSIDGSEYSLNKKHNNLQDEPDNSKNNGTSLLLANKILIKEKALKRSKNSILKKADNDQSKQFNLMLNKSDIDYRIHFEAKRQLDELGLQSSEVLEDDEDNHNLPNQDNLVLKKIESRNSSLNTSRKNSLDSNSDSLIKLTNKTTVNDKKELNESTTSTGKQSLLATSSFLARQQNQQQQQKKKKKEIITNIS